MSFNGVRLFRYALLAECAGNFGGAAMLLLYPQTALGYFVTNTAQITPLSTSIAQWLGGITAAISVPLLLVYPNTEEGIKARRTVYWALGSIEMGIMAVMGYQGFRGDSGMTAQSLTTSILVLGSFLGWRLWCLQARPGWVDAQHNARKAQ